MTDATTTERDELLAEIDALTKALARCDRALQRIAQAAPGNHQDDPCYGRIRELKDIAMEVLDE